MYRKCPNCGGFVTDQDMKCPRCQCDLTQFNGGYRNFNGGGGNNNNNYYRRNQSYDPNAINGSDLYNSNDMFATDPFGKSRGVTALLAIFLGGFGVQYFYLGKTTAGIVFLLATVLSCGILGTIVSILSLIQGILMLCMTNQEFTRKYVSAQVSFPLF